MRDKLIELLKYRRHLETSELADHLIANGVIVAPMPMTEELREELEEYVHKRCVDEL